MAKDLRQENQYPVKTEKGRLYFLNWKTGYVNSCQMEKRKKKGE